MATFCRKCGERNEPDARFCESCGSPMLASMQPVADVARQAPNADLRHVPQQPRRRRVLYAVGAVAVLGIGIIAAAFFAPTGPLAGLASTLRGVGAAGDEAILYYVGRNGKWGYVNKAGAEVIPFQYDAPPPDAKGRMPAAVIRGAAPYPVFKGGKWTLVSRQGSPLGQRVFDEMQSDPQTATICGSVGKDWGCVDATGRETIPFKYEAVQLTLEEPMPVKSDGHWGFVNRVGAFVIRPLFRFAGPFQHGVAKVQFDDKDWGLIDATGKEISKRRYKLAQYPGDGVWPVYDGEKWAIANLSGEIKRVTDLGPIGQFKDGFSVAPEKKGENSRRVVIDTSGNIVSYLPNFNYSSFKNDISRIGENYWGTSGLIRKNGRYIVPPMFGSVSNFIDGVSIVRKGDEAWAIDTTGRPIWPKEKRNIAPPTNDLDTLITSSWRVIREGDTTSQLVGWIAKFGQGTINFDLNDRHLELPYIFSGNGILNVSIGGKLEDWEFIIYGSDMMLFEGVGRVPMLLTRVEPVGNERENSSRAKDSSVGGSNLFSSVPSLFGGGTTPSESSARTVFENINAQDIKDGSMKIESFQKANGQKMNHGGVEAYELEYVATVLYPKGVMPECVEVVKNGTYDMICFNAQVRGYSFKTIGQREKLSGKTLFKNTERGWQGEDGKIY